jgi:hypothetical protein
MDKPTVRLESGTRGTKRKKAAAPNDQNVKLAIRLNEAVNDALRGLIRYRGDLSAMAIDALTSVDLESAGLVSSEEQMVRDTTITLPKTLHRKIKKVAEDRGKSMNIMVSSALAHWLAKKGALKLR